jgi:hypothetical protein
MKTQLAALCLAETRFIQIRLHLHDEIAAAQGGEKQKDYLRDRLTRCLAERFDPVPWFYVVIEDRDTFGVAQVRPHLHGAIQIPRVPLPTTKVGRPRARFLRIQAAMGLEEAEYSAGRVALHAVLQQATGNTARRGSSFQGRSQNSNIWKRKPYRPLFNEEWVSYALKNMKAVSSALPNNRLSTSRSLSQEAKRLWSLIRDGEDAVSHWPIR